MRKAVVVFGVISLSLAFAVPVLAQDLILNDRQIEDIRSNCTNSQAALRRVHTSDALLRVNIGQRYENISLRLMAPLNSRVALNGLDVVELATITSDYTEELQDFVANYREYETKMSSALRIDCDQRPVEYYSLIEEAREGRAKVRANIVNLGQFIEAYRDEAKTFNQQQGDDE